VKPVVAKANLSLGNYYATLLLLDAPEVAGVKTSREDAVKLARGAYETVIRDFGDQADAVAGAKLGLAALAEGEARVANAPAKFDEAETIYKELSAPTGPYAGTAYAAAAATRLAALPTLRQTAHFGPPGVWKGDVPSPPSPSTTAPGTAGAPATAPASGPAAPATSAAIIGPAPKSRPATQPK
jgi:hypothetical protein